MSVAEMQCDAYYGHMAIAKKQKHEYLKSIDSFCQSMKERVNVVLNTDDEHDIVNIFYQDDD